MLTATRRCAVEEKISAGKIERAKGQLGVAGLVAGRAPARRAPVVRMSVVQVPEVQVSATGIGGTDSGGEDTRGARTAEEFAG